MHLHGLSKMMAYGKYSFFHWRIQYHLMAFINLLLLYHKRSRKMNSQRFNGTYLPKLLNLMHHQQSEFVLTNPPTLHFIA
jgi:hypothetical protein